MANLEPLNWAPERPSNCLFPSGVNISKYEKYHINLGRGKINLWLKNVKIKAFIPSSPPPPPLPFPLPPSPPLPPSLRLTKLINKIEFSPANGVPVPARSGGKRSRRVQL